MLERPWAAPVLRLLETILPLPRVSEGNTSSKKTSVTWSLRLKASAVSEKSELSVDDSALVQVLKVEAGYGRVVLTI